MSGHALLASQMPRVRIEPKSGAADDAWDELARYAVAKQPNKAAARVALHGVIDRAALHIAELDAEGRHLDRLRDALKRFSRWADRSPDRMQRPDGSAWNSLREAFTKGRIGPVMRDAENAALAPFFASEPQVFLVEHDWGAAFRGATEFDEGTYPLPFPHCAFEFQISGMRAIAVCISADDGFHECVVFWDCGSLWLHTIVGSLVGAAAPNKDAMYGANLLLRDNVRGICIALDAEVATHEVVRARHTSIVSPRTARAAVNDYRVVSLARRSRAATFPSSAESGRHVRLHFRRGHWRHYETHKTWIRWMMVGDPDLGFIDKHYRA